MMTRRFGEILGVATAILVLSLLLKQTTVVSGQQPARPGAQAAAKPGGPPKTPWGDPDLQGTWDNTTQTPFERPAKYAGRAELTDQEVADLKRAAEAAARSGDRAPR